MIFKIAALTAALVLVGACSRNQTRTEPVRDTAASTAFDAAKQTGKPVIVDFNATWCGPCRAFAPVFEEASKRYGDRVNFVSIDVDQNPQLAESYNVQSIPTIIFLKPNGSVARREVGAIPADTFDGYIKELIQE